MLIAFVLLIAITSLWYLIIKTRTHKKKEILNRSDKSGNKINRTKIFKLPDNLIANIQKNAHGIMKNNFLLILQNSRLCQQA